MIPFYKPWITEADSKAVSDVLLSGRLTTGEKVKEFEAKFAEYIGAKECVMFSSLTAGYLALLDILGVRHINIPSATYISMVNMPRKMGIGITYRDEWIAGKPYAIITDRGTIYDSAHYLEKDLVKKDEDGYWLFSFHATKLITTGNGGCICLNSPELAMALRTLRNDGRVVHNRAFEYSVLYPGWTADLSDFQAALGISQLSRIEEIISDRRRVTNTYQTVFQDSRDNISYYVYQKWVRGLDSFIRHARQNGIGVSRHFIPIHTQPAHEQKVDLPQTERLSMHLVSIPLYHGMTDEDIKTVIEFITKEEQQ